MFAQAPGRPQRNMEEWRARWGTPRRHLHNTETRPFFVTSKFLVYVLLLMGRAITAGSSASVDARFFWEWATLATIAYMLSRGLAKSGTRSRAWDPREELDTER